MSSVFLQALLFCSIVERSHASFWRQSGRLAFQQSGARQKASPAVSRKGLRSHEQEVTAENGVESMCLKTTVLSIVDPVASPDGSKKGWMTQDDWGEEVRKINSTAHPFVKIGIDGFPCAQHGCCQHNMTIRMGGSDWYVVQHVINEYAEVLTKMFPWKPKAILEGGGNIGVATSLFAFLYPQAKIITLEPQPENCHLLKQNTKAFSNVVVHCLGLWDKENVAVDLEMGGDGSPWAWRLKEVPANTKGAVQTTSPPALLKQHGLHAFDLAKIDIEGAEFTVFNVSKSRAWLGQTQALLLELHGKYGDADGIRKMLGNDGFAATTSGEYDVFYRSSVRLADQ